MTKSLSTSKTYKDYLLPSRYQEQGGKSLTPIIVAIVTILVVIVIGIVLIIKFTSKNPYGPAIKIDNFSKYYPTVPSRTRDILFAFLYDNVELNSPDRDDLTSLRASIRENSVTENRDSKNGFDTSTALVDLPEINQTYSINLYWHPDTPAENDSLPSTVVASVVCPNPKDSINPDFKCHALFSDAVSELFDKYPIMYELPTTIAYYDSATGYYVSYRLSYRTNEDNTDITIVITDYTGGNRSRAITKLSEDYDIDPKAINIEYLDESYKEYPAKAPGAAS